MSLTLHSLSLDPTDLRAARRVNAIMAVAPRLKIGGWQMAVGARLNGLASHAVGRASAALMSRRGIRVSSITIDAEGGPVPLRILEPASPVRGLVVDLHGGGWVVGSAALNDPLTSHLAQDGFVVVSVDYRLLSERSNLSLGDAVDDCAAAIAWSLGDGFERFGVEVACIIGESAGAHLGALAMLKLRDAGARALPPCVFVQGVFDLSGTPSVRSATKQTLLFDGPNLQRDLGRLAPDRDDVGLRSPDISPLYADLSGLSPALFVMGEEDPLRDDSRLMAEAWAVHNPATLLRVQAAAHGFQHFSAKSARLTQAWIRRWLNAEAAFEGVSVDKTNR